MKYVRRGTPDDALDAFKRTDVPKGHKAHRTAKVAAFSEEARGPDVEPNPTDDADQLVKKSRKKAAKGK